MGNGTLDSVGAAGVVCDVRVRWAPGHTGIEGNEAADKLADLGARQEDWDAGPASEPTVSGILSTFRNLRRDAQRSWWTSCSTKLSRWYRKWGLEYQVKLPPELNLPRGTLHRLLAIRSSHGDFSWYHTKFNHTDAKLVCSCGHPKSPEHLVLCGSAGSPKRLSNFGQDDHPRHLPAPWKASNTSLAFWQNRSTSRNCSESRSSTPRSVPDNRAVLTQLQQASLAVCMSTTVL